MQIVRTITQGGIQMYKHDNSLSKALLENTSYSREKLLKQLGKRQAEKIIFSVLALTEKAYQAGFNDCLKAYNLKADVE